MKSLRVFRFKVLAGAAGMALLAALWLDGPDASDDAAAPGAQARQRAAHGSAMATPAQAAGAGALRATPLLGGAAMAATADRPASAPVAPVTPREAATPAADRSSVTGVTGVTGATGATGATAALAALAALDTTLVSRRVAPGAAAENAFASKTWFVAPPAPPPMPEAPPPQPPPPQAPPLPFKYMGSMNESAERTVWYLMQGERLIMAGTGDVIDSIYRTEGAEGGQLRFTYLPLNQRQTLSIGVPP